MAQGMHRDQLVASSSAETALSWTEKGSGAIRGAAPWTRITKLLKCSSSFWPQAPSWCLGPAGKSLLLTVGGQSRGPTTEGTGPGSQAEPLQELASSD